MGVALVGKADDLQQLQRAFFCLTPVYAGKQQGEADVFNRRALHQQVELLKDHPNTAPGLPELLFR